MSTIRLKSMRLENFKKYKDEIFNFDGNSIVISGGNRQGKSTIKNAYLWCLTGKDESGRANYRIRTNDAPIEAEPAVTVIIVIDSVETEIKRTLRSVYKGKGIDRRYDGDTTQCYIDTIPKSMSEYNAYIAGLFPLEPNIFTDIFHFAEKLKDEARRDLLTTVFGLLSDEQVFERKVELKPLIELKGKHSIEDFKIINKEKEKNISLELGSGKHVGNLQSRIDEAIKAMTDPINVEEQQNLIDEANSEIKCLESQKVKLVDNTVTSEKKSQIELLQTDYKALISSNKIFQDEYVSKEKGKVKVKIDDAFEGISEVQANIRNVRQGLENLQNNIAGAQTKSKQHKAKLAELQVAEWEGDTICPTCGQAIPEEKIKEAKGNFNENKVIKIEGIESQITELNALIASSGKGVSEKEEQIILLENDLLAKQKNKSELEKLLNEIKPKNMAGFSKKSKELEDQILKLKNELKVLSESNDNSVAIADMDNKIEEQKRIISDCQEKIAQQATNNKQQNRITELQEERIKLSKELDIAQNNISLCDKFITAKAELITEDISKHFEGISFKLFDTYKSEGLKNDCQILMNGQQYGDFSMSEKIVASIKVINGLNKHFSFAAPIFVDNANELDTSKETIKGIKTDAQLILIKVNDNKLQLSEV
ncbi:MAG: hypothetical protein AB9836_04970 [Aminipila sp.]